MYEIDAIVVGKVQGVGFRAFAKKHASALWLTGFAENKGQGELHIVVQGAEEKLKKFIGYLQKGPFLARVRNVEVEWREPKEHFKEFLIV
jgi:acylphosphatase